MFNLPYSKCTKERCIKLSATAQQTTQETCTHLSAIANEAGAINIRSLSVLFLSVCYNYYLEIRFPLTYLDMNSKL